MQQQQQNDLRDLHAGRTLSTGIIHAALRLLWKHYAPGGRAGQLADDANVWVFRDDGGCRRRYLLATGNGAVEWYDDPDTVAVVTVERILPLVRRAGAVARWRLWVVAPWRGEVWYADPAAAAGGAPAPARLPPSLAWLGEGTVALHNLLTDDWPPVTEADSGLYVLHVAAAILAERNDGGIVWTPSAPPPVFPPPHDDPERLAAEAAAARQLLLLLLDDLRLAARGDARAAIAATPPWHAPWLTAGAYD